MSNGSLLLVPVGGLANRMRAVMSAYNLCLATESKLQVVWFRDWALNAKFCDIFESVDKSRFTLREARLWDYVINDRPRRRNLWVPHLPQLLIYQDCIYEQYVTPYKMKGLNFEEWLRGKRCYMSCYQEFGTFQHSLYKEVFHPVEQIRSVIADYQSRFSAYTVGMHIRRTDNSESIEKSPTALFVDAGLRELESHPDMRIFLATDCEEVKREMRETFGDRLITPCAVAERGNAEGIRMAVAEMWTLAATVRIYGSAGSSYSTMAASVGGTEAVILEKH